MIACPCAKTIDTQSSSVITIKFPAAIVDTQPKHENHAILEDLKRWQQKLTLACYAAGVWGIAGIGFFAPLVAVAVPPLPFLLGKLQTISQQIVLMKRLIEAFEEEGIEIHPRLKPSGLKEIDFFLKFPDKRFIILMIESLGDSVVSYNEKLEALQYRRKGSGLKTLKPDLLSEVTRQQLWIGKERRDLKGGSSRDARRPVAKMIVFWGVTRLNDHNEHLYSTMAGYKALWIRKEFGTVCLVEEKEVIEAIQAYLAKEREN